VKGERAPARRLLFASTALLGLAACAGKSPSMLDPKGPAARTVTSIWWPMVAVATGVTIFVVAMGWYGVVRGRHVREEDIKRDVPWGDRFILIAGLGVTGAILIGFFVFSVARSVTLARAEPGIDITVIGHDWWWEVRYPNGAVTANEIHIPAGQRVNLTLTSVDVIHSFWVPQLGPKTDLIPGRTTHAWIEADHPGEFRGQCFEYCGLQHAHMVFFVIAETPDAFGRWVDDTAQPANAPTSQLAAEGQQVFLSNTCIGCHAIKGTSATASLGPDLTHMATRQTIAAGTVPLTAASLAQWITNPDDIKPGTTMPPTTLTSEQLNALVTYLLSLGFRS
jgi:cytochrome c oxidase subunit II